MSCFNRLLIFFVIAFGLPHFAGAATFGNIRNLIHETCRYYDGSPLTTFISAENPGVMENPLTTSPLGQLLVVKNAKSAYSNYEYFTRDPSLTFLINSPDFGPALDECYGKNEMAKVNFIFLLRRVELEGKTMAAFGEALSWAAGGIAFAKVSVWLGLRVNAIKTILLWSRKAIVPAATLTIGNSVYQYIRYKRGKIKKAPLEIDGKMSAAAQQDLADSRKMALDSIHDLEEQQRTVHQQVTETTDPAQKAKLIGLENETSELINKLKQQLN